MTETPSASVIIQTMPSMRPESPQAVTVLAPNELTDDWMMMFEME